MELLLGPPKHTQKSLRVLSEILFPGVLFRWEYLLLKTRFLFASESITLGEKHRAKALDEQL